MEYATPVQFLDGSRVNKSTAALVCYAPTMISIDGVWHGEHVLDYSVPLFIVQLIVVIAVSRLTAAALYYLRQPRYVTEAIAGIIMGPSIMGRIPMFSMTMFPLRSLLIMEAIANLGIIFFIFIVGVELELGVIFRMGQKSVVFAVAAMAAPLAIGVASAFGLSDSRDPVSKRVSFVIYVGVLLCVTSFSILSRILADLKLLNSDVGRLAISSALINNTVAWGLMSFAISLSHGGGTILSSVWASLSGMVLFGLCFACVRPATRWVMKRTPEGEEIDELYSCMILVGVLLTAFTADVIGIHWIVGAFMYGLAVPNGPVGEAVIGKIEEFVTGLLLPLFFAISGQRTDVKSITNGPAALKLVMVVFAGGAAKLCCCVLAATFYGMTVKDGLELGLLMNTKGLVELIILNIAIDKHILSAQAFTIMVIMSVVFTAIIGPVINSVVRSSRRFVAYKRRTVRWPNPESELRALVCVHHPYNVPALITLLDAANPTKRSPVFVYALHLIELTGRATTLLVNSSNAKDASVCSGQNKVHQQMEQVVNAFETYEQHAGGVSVQALSTFSPYQTMHEDVCGMAEDKHVALILLPFHKHLTVDGHNMQETHPSIRSMNQSVIAASPCSFGILIDRGLGLKRSNALSIGLIFFGGPDDRESLAFATRMAGHPNVAITLHRFIPAISGPELSPEDSTVDVTPPAGDDRERGLDEACLEEFRARWEGGEVEYAEHVLHNAEETVAEIRETADSGVHDLFIVGRGYRSDSPLTAGLTEWSECPELGPIGDMLSSSDFASAVSVLVVQQGRIAEGMAAPVPAGVLPESPGGRHVRLYVSKAM